MAVTTTQSWYLCLLLRQTQTKGVILTTGCSQRQTGSDLLSHVWIKLHDISSKTKTPSHPLSSSSSVPQKTASQGQPQSQKSLTHGLTKSAERCWGPDGLLTEKSTEEGGLEQRHSCPLGELRHRPDYYLLGKKESHGQNMSQSLTPTPQSSMCGTGWGKYLAKMFAHPSGI